MVDRRHRSVMLRKLCRLLCLVTVVVQSAPSSQSIEERLAVLEERTKHLAQPSTIDSCSEVSQSGIYQLRLPLSTISVTVVCETNSSSFSKGESDAAAGAWLVFQQRLDGSVNFARSGAEYRGGFGTVDPRSEFWLGLEVLHQLTRHAHYELVVELRNEEGRYGYARYSQFGVAGEAVRYKLHKLGKHSGTIESKMEVSKEEPFYAQDDISSGRPRCDRDPVGGWWFYECRRSNLNGPYEKHKNTERGIFWDEFAEAATYSRMMIRRKVFTSGVNRDVVG